MKLSSNFYKPLAIGAPQPVRELPVRPERMIHFFPPHIEKLRARVPDMVKQVDVFLGNLEDAIPADAKEAARAGGNGEPGSGGNNTRILHPKYWSQLDIAQGRRAAGVRRRPGSG